jgi:hypothetical protein
LAPETVCLEVAAGRQTITAFAMGCMRRPANCTGVDDPRKIRFGTANPLILPGYRRLRTTLEEVFAFTLISP